LFIKVPFFIQIASFVYAGVNYIPVLQYQ